MTRYAFPVLAVALILFFAGCAAGDMRFDESPAGFFAGLWHGIILIVAFVISLFSDTVGVYEVNNAGPLYDLGFVLGASGALGGGCRITRRKKKKKKSPDTEKVEAKVKAGIRAWLDESGKTDDEWAEIAKKVEEKIKRELRGWAENDQ
ncbi:MAG: hypothetical protein ABFS86_05010 [Planctomycetota bacterium]